MKKKLYTEVNNKNNSFHGMDKRSQMEFTFRIASHFVTFTLQFCMNVDIASSTAQA